MGTAPRPTFHHHLDHTMYSSDDLTDAHGLADWLDLEGPTDAAQALREALEGDTL